MARKKIDFRVWRGPEDNEDPSAIDVAQAYDLGLLDNEVEED